MKKKAAAVLLTAILLASGCARETAPGKDQVQTEAQTETQRETQHETMPPVEETTIEPLELPTKEQETTPPVAERNQEIIIASDIHYLARALTDGKSGFTYMVEHGDGKLANYVWEITDAFLDEVIEANPKILILSGDLSLNGEKLSHEELAMALDRVEDAGIPVAVIPGNHDINCNEAAEFKGSQQLPAEKTTPEDFAKIYRRFGYGEAISRDPHSLSYTYQMDDDTWLMMLDSCQYEYGAKVGGMIRLETYEWMEEQLEYASDEGMDIIPVAHHNLLDESQVYQEDCTIEHAEELERVLGGWGMDLFLSGHLHVQHFKTSEDYEIHEIVTSALSTAPCQYGILTFNGYGNFQYRTKQVDMVSWARRNEVEDENLLNFPEYSREFLQNVFYNNVMDAYRGSEISKEKRIPMAELYARLNTWSYAGRAVEIAEETRKDPAYQLWQEYRGDDILFLYMEEILRDATHDYNTFQTNE